MMNERIKELKRIAEEFYIGFPDSIYKDKVDEKFAELIVKECAKVASLYDSDPGIEWGTIFEEHFGVEE